MVISRAGGDRRWSTKTDGQPSTVLSWSELPFVSTLFDSRQYRRLTKPFQFSPSDLIVPLISYSPYLHSQDATLDYPHYRHLYPKGDIRRNHVWKNLELLTEFRRIYNNITLLLYPWNTYFELVTTTHCISYLQNNLSL